MEMNGAEDKGESGSVGWQWQLSGNMSIFFRVDCGQCVSSWPSTSPCKPLTTSSTLPPRPFICLLAWYVWQMLPCFLYLNISFLYVLSFSSHLTFTDMHIYFNKVKDYNQSFWKTAKNYPDSLSFLYIFFYITPRSRTQIKHRTFSVVFFHFFSLMFICFCLSICISAPCPHSVPWTQWRCCWRGGPTLPVLRSMVLTLPRP